MQQYGLQCPVYSIDLKPPQGLDDARIRFLQGDVQDLAPVFAEQGLMDAPHPWLVTEDSAHHYQTCSAALRQLADWMQPGDLLVMEDGFRVDRDLCDLFGKNATYAPNGWLWKT
ncbi:MAG: hypothetical protein ACLFTD_07645 [Halochromatium sp.]